MMDSSLMSRLRFKRTNLFELTTDDDDSSVSSSRPGTRDGRLMSTSRLSADSGAGSLEDFHRRGSSPLPTTFLDYWDGVRRHTAPPRKTAGSKSPDLGRPNTVHAWETYPSRSTMSKYTPLPAIGLKQNVQRKYCFQEDLAAEDDSSPSSEKNREIYNFTEDDGTDNKFLREDNFMFKRPHQLNVSSTDPSGLEIGRNTNEIQDHITEEDESNLSRDCHSTPDSSSAKIFSVDVNSDSDSDYDYSCESGVVYTSDEDENSSLKPRRSIVRSATFTIEDKRFGENTDIDHPKLLLAVRLPDGSRVSGYFNGHDTLWNVCDLVLQNSGKEENMDKFELVTTEVPKRVFSDFSINLIEANIQDKTLLNLQLCDDNSDSG